jgi:hypothetical protein
MEKVKEIIAHNILRGTQILFFLFICWGTYYKSGHDLFPFWVYAVLFIFVGMITGMYLMRFAIHTLNRKKYRDQ